MFTFKRRAIHVAVVAALALWAPPATPIEYFADEKGNKFAVYTEAEHMAAARLFFMQRARIQQLERQLEDLKIKSGCS